MGKVKTGLSKSNYQSGFKHNYYQEYYYHYYWMEERDKGKDKI